MLIGLSRAARRVAFVKNNYITRAQINQGFAKKLEIEQKEGGELPKVLSL